MIVDSHAHIWRPLAPGSSPVATIVSGEVDISAAMFRECLKQHGVDRAVLVQPVYPGEDNSYVADAAAHDPDMFAAVCVVDPRKPDAAERLAYWVTDRGCRGLRLRPKVTGEERCFGDASTFPLWHEAERLEIAINVLGAFEHLAAVAKLAARFPAVPIVPTAIESGVLPGYDVTTWYGFFAPRGTPATVIAKLHKTLNDGFADETVRKRLVAAGVIVKGSTPEEFGKFMADEYKRWNTVRESAGIPQQ